MKTKIQKLRDLCKKDNDKDVWAAVSFHKHNGGWLDKTLLPKLLDALEKADEALERQLKRHAIEAKTHGICANYKMAKQELEQARKEISDIMEGDA